MSGTPHVTMKSVDFVINDFFFLPLVIVHCAIPYVLCKVRKFQNDLDASLINKSKSLEKKFFFREFAILCTVFLPSHHF